MLVNLVLAVLALGAVGCSLLLVRGSTATTTKTAADQRTVTVAQGAVTATVTADGALEAASTASAAFATSGTVTGVYVKVGQRVASGQLLAKVDPAAAQRALDLANANHAAAEDALARAKKAGTDTSAAADEVTTTNLAVTDAKAAVTGTKLTAPMAGTVIAVNGTVGSSAASSTTSGTGVQGGSTSSTGFVEIADLADLQVTADFAEADATKLAAGQSATITWSALTGATATGKLVAVDPSATSSDSVVTYGATISLDTLPTGAKPGQTVSVTVVTGTAANVTYVNSAAVTVSGSRYTVTVRKADGTTEKRTVQVGLAGDDAYEITSGLTVGEKVVLPESSGSSSSSSKEQGPGGNFGGAGGPPAGAGGNGGPP